MKEIDSLDDPRVSCFNSLKSKQLLKQQLFIADSLKVINQYTHYFSHLSQRFKKIFGLKDLLSQINGIDDFNPDNIYYAEKDLLQRVVGHRLHQGIMALGMIPFALKFEDLVQQKSNILVLNNLNSPENVGEIVRTARSFGVNLIIFDHKTCHPYLRRCVRVSMGHIGGVELYQSHDLIEDLKSLKDHGFKVIGTANQNDACDLNNYSWKKNQNVIIMGSEGYGIDKNILTLCDDVIKIKISSQVDSLNVASAAGIILYDSQNNCFG